MRGAGWKGADGCGWVRMGCAGRGMEGCGCAARPEGRADGVRGAWDGRARMCGEAGEERGRGARGGRGVRGAGANRKAREAGRGVWEAAARGEGGRKMGI